MAERERGAALLTVLMLVAVLAVITAVALERLTLATRMAQNASAADQGRAMLLAGEALAAARLADLAGAMPDRTVVPAGWLGTPQAVNLPGGGTISATVRDADNCFNLNSLVVALEPENLVASRTAITRFATLMRLIGVGGDLADRIAGATADFIDSDQVTLPGGAEDSSYLGATVPYRTAGNLLADPSELRAVAGVTPEIFGRLSPWLCALPAPEESAVNINTLLPEQAILLTALTGGRFAPDAVRQMLALRPVDGYGSLNGLWSQPALARLPLTEEDKAQVRLKSRWFEVGLRVTLGATDVNETALFDAGQAPARLVRRTWGDGS